MNMRYEQPARGEIPPFIPKHVDDPAFQYKKSLRRENMIIFIVLLAYFVLQNIAASIVMLVQFFAGGGMNLILASSDPLTDAISMMNALPGGTGPSLLVGVIASAPIFLLLRGIKSLASDVVSRNNRMTFGIFLCIFIVAQAFQTVDSIASGLSELLFSGVDFSPNETYASSMDSVFSSVTGLVYAMLVGPIFEELIFRGAIMKSLEKYGGNYAIVLSSMIFGLYHVFLLQAIFAFCVGILLAYTARIYSLKWAILLHILINSSAVIVSSALKPEIATICFTALFVIAIPIVIVRRRMFKEAVAAGRPAAPSTWKYAFSAPAMIVFLIVVAAMSVTMMILPGI
jgi:membrane protease YdiL (CAAX protease family)